MAHGRVQTAAATNPPILTGVPASGMAYLDRPAEAGYFIFPDLSVRHEGYFRLSFSLFETTKEEKDFDLEPSDPNLPPGVDWRMEIKTQPFNVFSAKKFPGLMESTQLSKTVADQGCRVRIRRDVRMRKRDSKGNGFDRRDDEYRRRTGTPATEDPISARSRSHSNSSEQRMAYGAEHHRRPPGIDGYHPHQQAHPPPPGYEIAPSSSRAGHLSFGDQQIPQYATPRQFHHPPKPSMPSQTSSMVYPSAPYGKPDHVRQVYPAHARNMSSTCPSPGIMAKPDVSHDRASSRHISASPSLYAESASSREACGTSSLTRLLPRPTTQSCKTSESPKTRVNLNPLKITSLVTPSPKASPIEPQQVAPPILPSLPTGGKRKHDRVFSQNLDALHNGQRQFDAHFYHQRPGLVPEPDQGQYPRADGNIEVVQFNHYQYY